MHQKTLRTVTVEENGVFHSCHTHTHTHTHTVIVKIHIYFWSVILFRKLTIHSFLLSWLSESSLKLLCWKCFFKLYAEEMSLAMVKTIQGGERVW